MIMEDITKFVKSENSGSSDSRALLMLRASNALSLLLSIIQRYDEQTYPLQRCFFSVGIPEPNGLAKIPVNDSNFPDYEHISDSSTEMMNTPLSYVVFDFHPVSRHGPLGVVNVHLESTKTGSMERVSELVVMSELDCVQVWVLLFYPYVVML
jgi:hypothetical protein